VSTVAVTLEELRAIDLFDGLGDDQLAGWAEATQVRTLEPAEILAEQGEIASFHLVLEGSMRAIYIQDGREEPVGQHTAPTWIGAIPVLTEGSIGVRMQADTACRIGTIAPDPFMDLVLAQRPVHRRIMRRIEPVVGRIAAVEQNRERLAALGTMAAGLAHELNNPAAAARRAAADLNESLDALAIAAGDVLGAGIDADAATEVVRMGRAAVARAVAGGALGALDAADAEDALHDVLEEIGVPEPWRMAEPLAAAGVDAAWLRRVAELAGPSTAPALGWIAAGISARRLGAELRQSAEQMSRLVGAVKSYAYLDRGDLVEVDVHEGLETTLVVLGHKLKHTAIRVERDYDRTLPRLNVRGGELNQVWTNLLDNAIDALGDAGTIAIATRRDGDCAVIEIGDDGPGVPAEIRERVFDPFFTTKAVGAGSGLGLETARRIVTERHRGSIALESEPGRTVLRVRLPFRDTAR
jgi:signal transduction histidine kinase